MIKAAVISTQDPKNIGRVQIAVPSRLTASQYDLVLNESNIEDDNELCFWAQSISTSNLNKGDIVWVDTEGIDESGNNNFVIISKLFGDTDERNGSFSLEYTGNYPEDTNSTSIMLDGSTLAEIGYNLTKKHESGGDYAAINPNDNGAISIGLIQWHAERAYDIIKGIADEDYNVFKSRGGERLNNGQGLNGGRGAWHNYTVVRDGEEFRILQNILNSDASKKVQDRQKIIDYQGYIDLGKSKGITDNATLLYFADMCNQYGNGRAVSKLNAITKPYTLDKLHNYVISHESDSKVRDRRNAIYEDIKEVERQGKLNPSVGSFNASIGTYGVNSTTGWIFPIKDTSKGKIRTGNTFDKSKKSYGITFTQDSIKGMNVLSLYTGTVKDVGYNVKYGNYITVVTRAKNNKKYYVTYGCLLDNSIKVQIGDKIKTSKVIARVGQFSGISNKPGLYLEVRNTKDGSNYPESCVNPLELIGENTATDCRVKKDRSNFQWYYQMGYWYNHRFGPLTGGEACGICSLAMIMTSYSGKNYNPDAAFQYGCTHGLMSSSTGYVKTADLYQGFNNNQNEFHLKAEYIPNVWNNNGWNRVKEACDKGGCALINVNTKNGIPSGHGSLALNHYAEHYMVLTHITDGNRAHVADPGGMQKCTPGYLPDFNGATPNGTTYEFASESDFGGIARVTIFTPISN